MVRNDDAAPGDSEAGDEEGSSRRRRHRQFSHFPRFPTSASLEWLQYSEWIEIFLYSSEAAIKFMNSTTITQWASKLSRFDYGAVENVEMGCVVLDVID